MSSCVGPEDAREGLIQRLLRRYEGPLRRRLTSGPQTVERIEQEIAENSSELNKISQEEKTADAVGVDFGHTCACHKGHSAELRSWNKKQLTTLHGKIMIRRACTGIAANAARASATLTRPGARSRRSKCWDAGPGDTTIVLFAWSQSSS